MLSIKGRCFSLYDLEHRAGFFTFPAFANLPRSPEEIPMNIVLREQLKEVRKAPCISTPQAAWWAGVNERAWRSYETMEENSSSRVPPESTLRCFFSTIRNQDDEAYIH
jgi:hypothetical protein